MDELLSKEKTIGALVILLVFFCAFLFATPYGSAKNSVRCIEDGWYLVDNGNKTLVGLPMTIKTDDEVVLYRDFGSGDVGRLLSFYGKRNDLTVIYDGEVVHEYKADAGQAKSTIKSWICFDVPLNKTSGRLEMHYKPTNGKVELDQVYIGQPRDIFSFRLTQMSGGVLVDGIMFIIGIVVVCLGMVAYYSGYDNGRITMMGVFLIVCVIWQFTESPFAYYLFNESPALFTISHFAYICITLPFLELLQLTPGLTNNRSLRLMSLLSLHNIVGQSVVASIGLIPFAAMNTFSDVVNGFQTVVVLIILFIKWNRTKDSAISRMTTCLFIVGIPSLVNLALYYLTDFRDSGLLFKTGILCAVIHFFGCMAMDIAKIRKNDSEVLAQSHLSLIDSFTGLPNEAGCEEYMADHMAQIMAAPDPVMMYVWVDRLLETEMEEGLAGRNWVLMSVASCLKSVFANKGEIFRMDGNTFAVFVQDPGDMDIEKAVYDKILELSVQNKRIIRITTGHAYMRKCPMHTITNMALAAKFNMLAKVDMKAEKSGGGERLNEKQS